MSALVTAARVDPFDVVAAAEEPGVASRPFLFADDATLGYRAVAGLVRDRASSLRQSGVGPGSAVAFPAPCTVETVITILALVHIGATLVPVHPRSLPHEADALVARAGASVVLGPGAAASGGRPDDGRPQGERGADGLAIVFTSGTSGAPKGAVLTRDAFAASVRASAANLGVADDDRWLLCMPLAHVGGLSVVLRSVASRRAIVVVPGFTPPDVLVAVERHCATLLSAVPTMLRSLLDADQGEALRRLRAVLVGGAAAPLPLLQACERRGVVALATYGMTETCSQIATQEPPPAGEVRRARAGCGRPLPGVEVRILDADSREAAVGVAGRIHVRGRMIMRGYLGEAPRERGAFFDTGDDGWLDERGELHLVGRRTDRIVTGGENVDPVEVEHALELSGMVRAALVFGAPDDRWGHVVSAALVPAAGFDPSELATHVAATLAPHKRPRRFVEVDSLPTTAGGKLDRAGAVVRLAGRLRDL